MDGEVAVTRDETHRVLADEGRAGAGRHFAREGERELCFARQHVVRLGRVYELQSEAGMGALDLATDIVPCRRSRCEGKRDLQAAGGLLADVADVRDQLLRVLEQ